MGNDVVVSTGCGDACPYVQGTRYDDWKLTGLAHAPRSAASCFRLAGTGR